MRWVPVAALVVTLSFAVFGCGDEDEETPPTPPQYEVWASTDIESGWAEWDYYVFKYKPGGSLISSVEIPFQVDEITSFNNRLYGVENYWGMWTGYINVVYEMNPNTGSVINRFELPWSRWTKGINNDGTNLWALYGETGNEIYKISPAGSVMSSIPALNESVYGLGCYNSYLWYFDDDNKNIIQAKEGNGDIVKEYRYMPGMRSMAFDGRYIWCHSDDKIKRINHTNGQVLAEWEVPEGHSLRAVTVVFR